MSEKRAKLADVLLVKHGFAFPGVAFSDDPRFPTLVTPGNFALGGGFQTSKSKTFVGPVPEDYVLAPGSLVITMTDLSKGGDTLGLPARIPDDGVTYLHNQRIGLVQITDSSAVDAGYLNYYFRTFDYRSYILATASGSTVRHTSPARITAFSPCLPPLRTQRAIADVLGALDDKIATNTKLARTAENLASAIFEASLAESSADFSLAELAALITRGITPTYVDDGGVTVLNQKCVRNRQVTFDAARMSARDRAKSAKLLKLNDVLVNSTGHGTLGRVARWTRSEEATVDSHISIVRFDPARVDPVCGGHALLRLESIIEQMGEGSTGQTELSRTELAKLHLRVPGRSAQVAVGDRLANLAKLSNSTSDEKRVLVATRDALLPQLMSGGLRAKDAEAVAETVL